MSRSHFLQTNLDRGPRHCFLKSAIAVIAAIFGLLPTLALAADDAAEQSFKKMPWHLIDVWWDIGADQPFESYSVDVNISEDVAPDVNLYISPIGLGHLNKLAFYGGMQTQADAQTKHDQTIRKIGPGYLLSMWGERSLDAIRPASRGLCQSSGHEGDFVSVRCPHAWKRGDYTYRIVKMDKELIDDQPYTWVGAFVYSKQEDEHVFVGALRFKGENLSLGRNLANFVEVYGAYQPVSKIPKLNVTFGDLRVNGKLVEHPTARASYPKDVPDYANAVAKDHSIVIAVGDKVENRTERNVKLISK